MSFLTNLRNSKVLPANGPLAPTNRLQTQQSEGAKEPLTLDRLQELLKADAMRLQDRRREEARRAYNGSLEFDVKGNNGTIRNRDNRFNDTVTYDVYKNADALSNIVDQYDAAKTIEDKLNVIKQGWDDVGASSWKSSPDWFLAFSGWTQSADSRGDDTKNVSNVMRQIIDRSKKVYGPKEV